MQEVTTKDSVIWKIVRWAKQRSQDINTQASIPTLKKGTYEAKDPETKATLLRETCFPPPPEINISDIPRSQYPTPYPQNQEISEKEINDAA